MKLIKYFIQFIFIIFLFLLFKILGLELSKSFSSFIFKTIGPHFRSKKISHSNLTIAFPELDENEKEKIVNSMWATYGKIFAEYIFIKNFRQSPKFKKKIIMNFQRKYRQNRVNGVLDLQTLEISEILAKRPNKS